MPIEQLFSSGGVVMWPLLGFSILAVALILERLVFWLQVVRRQEHVVKQALQIYRRKAEVSNLEAELIPFLQKNGDLPMARIFLAGLELEDANPEEFRLALESAAQAELPLLKRFNTILETIISVAPLLGLLGTILGLIESFAALKIGDVGGTKTSSVTAGISEALISTASGLVVAIFTLLFANMFRGLYKRQIALIQEYGGQLELSHRRNYERGKMRDKRSLFTPESDQEDIITQ